MSPERRGNKLPKLAAVALAGALAGAGAGAAVVGATGLLGAALSRSTDPQGPPPQYSTEQRSKGNKLILDNVLTVELVSAGLGAVGGLAAALRRRNFQ